MYAGSRALPLALALRIALLLALFCTCCNDKGAVGAGPAASVAASAASPVLVLHEELSTPFAFDLVLAPDGAALVWAARDDRIRAQLLDANGVRRGAPKVVAQSAGVRELSAASRAARLGVAWLADHGGDPKVEAVLGDAASGTFGPTAVLDDGDAALRNARGHVAAATAEDGRLLIFYRAKTEPCTDKPALRCAQFGFRELDVGGPRVRGLPLSVPLACDVGLGGYVVAGERWYYAVCSQQTGALTTTIFSVQPEPMYASAVDTLAGCTPLGMGRLGADVIFAGRCGSARRGVRFSGVGEEPQALRLDVSLLCKSDSVLLAAGANSGWSHRVAAPADRLELVLPADIAPDGARALWTGHALLVARAVGPQLELRRACPAAL
jgi:hypothetical protein